VLTCAHNCARLLQSLAQSLIGSPGAQLPKWQTACQALTQSIMYVPLQVNRFRKSVLLIVQYKYLKSSSGDFYSTESDPPHKIMRYWLYCSICWFFHFQLTESVMRKWFVFAVYQEKIAARQGRTLIIFTWFIWAGGGNCTITPPFQTHHCPKKLALGGYWGCYWRLNQTMQISCGGRSDPHTGHSFCVTEDGLCFGWGNGSVGQVWLH